jgi:hypothetical protein
MSATTVRHPANRREFARRLAADGRSIDSIRRALAVHGPTPSWATVKAWVDPDYAEARRIATRRRMCRTPSRRPRRAWEIKLDRMRMLREATLGYRSIAVLMVLDFDTHLNEEQVRSILTGRCANPRKLIEKATEEEPHAA